MQTTYFAVFAFAAVASAVNLNAQKSVHSQFREYNEDESGYIEADEIIS